MDIDEVKKLKHGAYRVFWNEEAGGGSSIAVVGSMYSGARWIACSNWTARDEWGTPGSHDHKLWQAIDRVEPIETT